MINVSQSEMRRMRAAIEKLKGRYTSVEKQLGYRPHPIDFAEAVLGNKLDAWQRQYMIEALENPRIAIAACRQSGKSTVTGLFVAWCLIFLPGFTVLVASRSLRQASHFLTMVRTAILSFIPRDAMVQLNRLSMELPNGNMVISIPCAQPDAGRGFSPFLIILDEAAFAPDALFRAITPSLAATHGAMHMISSPNGRQGYFFEAFEGSGADIYSTHRVKWMDCPRIEPDFIAAEKISLGDLYFRQEYDAEFITPMGAFFGFTALTQFSEGEEVQLDGLDIRDMEDWLDINKPLPDPTMEDMISALDRTKRVTSLLMG